MQQTLDRGKERSSHYLLTLLENRLKTCRLILDGLQSSLADLSPELTPIHERLVSILRSISAANTRQKVKYSSQYEDESLLNLGCSFRHQKFKGSRINSRKSKAPLSMACFWLATHQSRQARILLGSFFTAV